MTAQFVVTATAVVLNSDGDLIRDEDGNPIANRTDPEEN